MVIAAHELRATPRGEPVLAVHAGLLGYADAWDRQRQLAERRARDGIADVLLTLEHPKVFTAGKSADLSHLLWDEADRAARGIEFYEVDRGGDVTYHGPGQLVGYPILRLSSIRGVVDYVRALERVCVAVAADFGIDAAPADGFPGVWVGDEKLVAIGARVSSRGVTSHGFAFNVTTDLTDFDGIVPCGIEGKGVCSLESLGVTTTVADVIARLRVLFGEEFGCEVREDASVLRPDPEVDEPALTRSGT
ncbi:MAG: lipoyl(octanoyl) transferase LipB [Nitriliruptorales bacterium]